MIWAHEVFRILDWLQFICGLFCAAAALLLIMRRSAFPAAESFFESSYQHPSGKLIHATILVGVFPAVSCILKQAQYDSYKLYLDTGIMGNAAWCLIHGHGWISSVLSDRSYFGIHFAFTTALFSPLLLLFENTMTLVLVQAIVVGSTICGVFLLGRRNCRSVLAAWCLALLAASQPLFHETLFTELNNVPLALPFFIWGAYLWESGRVWSAIVCMALFLTTREQAPFALAGVGLCVSARARTLRQLFIGFGIIAGSAILWFGEMSIIEHAKRSWPHPIDYWAMFQSLGGGSKKEVLYSILHRPWLFIRALVYPSWKLSTPIHTLLSLALLPVVSGAYFFPALIVWLPQQLCDIPSFQHLEGHYAAMVAGPLIWSSAHGLRRILRRTGRESHRLLLGGVLCLAAYCFLSASSFRPGPQEEILNAWEKSAPSALSAIPPNAKVWGDEFLLPHLAMRRYLKYLPYSKDYFFEDGLFMPDTVVLTRRWLALAEPPTRSRILRFLTAQKFAPSFYDENFIVMSNPATLNGHMKPVVWMKLP